MILSVNFANNIFKFHKNYVSSNDYFIVSFENALNLFKEDKFEESLTLLKTMDNPKDIKSKILISEIHLKLGNYRDSTTISNEIIENEKDDYYRHYAQLIVFECNIGKGNLSNNLEDLNKFIDELKNNTITSEQHDELIFLAYRIKIIILTEMGKFLNINKVVDRLLEVAIKIGTPYHLIRAYHQKARVDDYQGNLTEAQENYAKVIDIAKDTTHYYDYSSALHNIANINYYKGQYDKSLEGYKEEIQILSKVGAEFFIWNARSDIAWVLYAMGELEESVELFMETLYYLRSRDDPNNYFLAEVLTRLIIINCNDSKVEIAKTFLAELETINENLSADRINLYYNIALASILKVSKQVRKRAKAMDLFEKIAFEPIFDVEFTVFAFIALCELYVDDYRNSQEDESLMETEFAINKLYELADEQQSISIMSQANWLSAKIALIKGDMDEAKKLFIQAMTEADSSGYKNLAHRISDELDELEYSIELDPDQFSQLAWDPNLAENVLFNKIITTKEDSVLFFIMGDSGLPLYSRLFLDKLDLNENLISSFVHAINLFGAEALQTSEHIKRIQYQQYIILIEIIDNLHFIYVIQGKSYLAMRKLSKFIKDFQESEFYRSINSSSLFIHPDVMVEIDSLVDMVFSS